MIIWGPMGSMWAKHKLRQEQSIWCNNNRDCGYVPIDDQAIHRIGLRGRKSYLLYGCLALLGLLTLLNIIASLLIFFAFKLYDPHRAPVDFWSTNDQINFNKDVDIKTLVPFQNELRNMPDGNLTLVSSQDREIEILTLNSADNNNLSASNGTRFTFDTEGTYISNTEQFVVSNPGTREDEADKIYFSGLFSNQKLPFQPDNIGLRRVWTPKVENSISSKENMKIKSENGDINFRGNQGIIITTTYLNMSALKDIRIHTKEGSIILKSGRGSVLLPCHFLPFQGFGSNEGGLEQPTNSVDNYDSFPTTRLETGALLPNSAIVMPSRKLCVCADSGKIFAVPVTSALTNCLNGLQAALENPCSNP